MRSKVVIAVITAMEVPGGDCLTVVFETRYSGFMEELDAHEQKDVYLTALRKAKNAFDKEMEKAEGLWLDRKNAKLAGQMDIYDYA